MLQHPVPSTAPRACTTCRKRKRACDKQIPTCASCVWLQTCCVYEFPTAFPTDRPSYRSESGHKLRSTTLQDQVTALFAPPNSINSTIRTFFERIHPWLPFMSSRRFGHGISNALNYAKDHAFLLLPCVMHLLITVPATAEHGTHRSVLYQETKRLLALAESEGPSTLDLVQCRLMVALYEINHGATEEAYVSIGLCSRAGIVLGLDRHLQQRANDSSLRFEEERRTWWAIIVLDRLLRQQRPQWLSAVRDPTSNDILPMDDAEWDRRQHSNTFPDILSPVLRISTPSYVRVGYFARLAQVSHLLGRVLNSTCNPTADSLFNEEEAEQLRRALDMYAELLPREATATECSHYCGVVMMCYSAQLFLKPPELTAEMDARIEALTDDMIQMTKELNLELELMGSELLRPLALFATAQVARIYVRQCALTAHEKYKDGIRALLKLLRIFDARWRVAGVYTAEILGDMQRLQVHV